MFSGGNGGSVVVGDRLALLLLRCALAEQARGAEPVRVVTVDLERRMIVFVVMVEMFVLHLLLDHHRLVHLLLHDLFLLDDRRLVVVVHGFHFRMHVLLLLHFDRYVDDNFPPLAVCVRN